MSHTPEPSPLKRFVELAKAEIDSTDDTPATIEPMVAVALSYADMDIVRVAIHHLRKVDDLNPAVRARLVPLLERLTDAALSAN